MTEKNDPGVNPDRELMRKARELVDALKRDDATFVHPDNAAYDAHLSDEVAEMVHRLDLYLIWREMGR